MSDTDCEPEFESECESNYRLFLAESARHRRQLWFASQVHLGIANQQFAEAADTYSRIPFTSDFRRIYNIFVLSPRARALNIIYAWAQIQQTAIEEDNMWLWQVGYGTWQ